MKILRLALFAASILALVSTVASISSASEPAPTAPKGIEAADLDRGAEPCTDFYAFSNGAWRAANPIPPERSTGAGAGRPERKTAGG